MDDCLNQLLHYETQTRLLHWQTTSFAAHKAYGKLYDKLSDFTDSFVETVQGRDGTTRLKVDGPIAVNNLTDADAMTFIGELVEWLVGLSDYLTEPEDSALLNMRDEALGAAIHTRYLLTLR